jgi:hypothetical protein
MAHPCIALARPFRLAFSFKVLSAMKLGLLFLLFIFFATLPARSETIDVFDDDGAAPRSESLARM